MTEAPVETPMPTVEQAAAALDRQDLSAARDAVGHLLRQSPDDPAVLYHAGRLAAAERKGGEALAHFAAAVERAPASTEYRHAYAFHLFRAGRMDEVIQVLSVGTLDGPQKPAAENLLAVALTRKQRWPEALVVFDRAIAADPGNGEAIANKAAALFAIGRHKESLSLLLDAHENLPRNFQIVRGIAHSLIRLGNWKEMEALLDRAAPRFGDVNRFFMALFRYFAQTGENDAAQFCCKKAYAANPEDVIACANIGILARRLGRKDEALDYLNRALDLKPDEPANWNSLGGVYADLSQLDKAEDAYRKAIELDPEFIVSRSNLCRVLLEGGKPDEAAEMARGVLTSSKLPVHLIPFPFSVAQNVGDFDTKRLVTGRIWDLMGRVPAPNLEGALLAMLPSVREPKDYAALFREQCRWGDHVKAQAARNPLPPLPARGKRDRLKLAFLSSDLRAHNVTKFVMPVFDLYDRDRVEMTCYSLWPGRPDTVQEAIISKVDHFVKLGGANSRDVAKTIASHGIDVVIELNGITRFSQAAALAYRAAPVQVAWLGYPFTLGLEDIDYQLLDPMCAPVDEAHMREKPLLLPNSWICFDPDSPYAIGYREAPEIGDPPSERNGFITFGTMNKPYKYTDATIATWARVLKAVPGSKFHIVRPEARGEAFRGNIRKVFAEHDIEADRLLFTGNAPSNHMAGYNEIDICLDTFPQTGGVTTTESLWMGVPLITLVGREIFERMGKSILTNCGLDDLCVETEEAYVTKAAELADDPTRLRGLRRGLRDILRDCPICDTERFVRDFQDVLAGTV